MPATTDFLGRETPLESVRPRRFNPATARARGQANTGGTSWPRVRCAAPRKRRSRRRSGTRRKKAVPPSRRSRWPGSQPNRARTPSARRASRTTHRWRGLATRSGRGAMLLDPPLAGRVANAEAAGAMPIHPPSGEGFARIDNLHLRKSDPAHLSGPGLREESELFRLDPCLDDGPALDMHAGCRKSAANVVKSFLFWVLCYFCLPSGLPWPNQIASKRSRLSFRKARS